MILYTHLLRLILTCMHTDSMNTFIEVSFDKGTSHINCTFINQPRESKKHYIVNYGTANPSCELQSELKGHLVNSNSISLELQLNLEETTEVCFTVTANNGTKTVTVSGTYKAGMFQLPYLNISQSVSYAAPLGNGSSTILASVTVLICALVALLSALLIAVLYYYFARRFNQLSWISGKH